MNASGGPPEHLGLRNIDHRGIHHVLGRTGTEYAIWPAGGGAPLRTYPLDDQGWTAAWTEFQAMEARTAGPFTTQGPAAVAPAAGPPAPRAAQAVVDYRGSRHLLGRSGDAYLVWQQGGTAPLHSLPLTDQGWAEAWRIYHELEAPYAFVPTSAWRRGEPIPLRPMRAGQIFSGTFRLFWMEIGRLLLAVAPLVLLIQGLVAFLTISTLEVRAVAEFAGRQISALGPAPWVSFLSWVGGTLLMHPLASGFVAHIGLETVLGRRPSVGGALGRGLARFPHLLVAAAPMALALAPGLALFTFAPAGVRAAGGVLLFLTVPLYLFLLARLAPAPAIVMAEPVTGWSALRRSWALTRGSRGWRVLGSILLVGLIIAGVSFIFGIFIAVVSLGELTREHHVAIQIFGVVAAVVFAPLYGLVVTLLYLDGRVGEEGLDHQRLASDLDRASTAPGARPPAAPPGMAGPASPPPP